MSDRPDPVHNAAVRAVGGARLDAANGRSKLSELSKSIDVYRVTCLRSEDAPRE
jgi:hypothetical protein